MSSSPSDHKAVIRHEFTRQAAMYAANPLIADRSHLMRLVQMVRPRPQARVLDVAHRTGLCCAGVCGSRV